MNRHGLVIIIALLTLVGALARGVVAQTEPPATATPVVPLTQATGEAAITATLLPFEPVSDAYEPDGTWQEAKSIASLALQNRTLSPAGDVDWAKLTVQPGVWSAGFIAGLATLTLYDQNLNSLESQITNSDELSRECAVDALPGGTYYLKVEGNSGFQTGSYTLAWDDYEDCSLRPDVQPHTPAGYSYPVVPNSVKNTKQANSTLYAGKPTYFDWFFINSGGSRMPDNYYSRVYVGGQLAFEQKEGGIYPGNVGGGADWGYTVPSSGCHLVRFETDATGVAAESNEQNNVWERQFCWQAVNGWWGQYYNNQNLQGDPVFVRDDPEIQFSWQYNSPAPGIVDSDHFSIMWTRNVTFDAGTHRFELSRDDGMRFWIDSALKLDKWDVGNSVEDHVVIADLSQGIHELELAMSEIDGHAGARLGWKRCFSLTTQSNPTNGGQIGSPSPPPNCGSDKYIEGTDVSLTATANTGYTFVNWSGALSGDQATKSLTINGNKSVTANFSANCYTLTRTVSPSGSGTVTPNPPKSPSCSANDQYTYGAVVSLTATANTGYTFVNWSGALSGDQATKSLTMDGNKSVTANFSANCYTLTRTVSPSGSGTVTPNPPKSPNCSANDQYTYGAIVSLTATANTGYTFVNWSGALSGDQATKSLTMDGNKSVTANFSPVCYTLMVSIYPSGTGVGTITPTPPKSAGCPASSQYTYGEVVSLMAMSSSGYTFSHWSGDLTGPQNPKSVIMNGNKSVTAHFTANCYTLTRNVSPSGSGSITPNPPKSPNCSANDQYTYGAIVSLTATANTGYTFVNWSGALSGPQTTKNLTIDGNKSVTANFSANCYTLTRTVSPSGSGTVTPNPPKSPNCSANDQYTYGATVTLTATANGDYVFSHWSGSLSGSQYLKNLTVDGNESVTANFSRPTVDCYLLQLDYVGDGSSPTPRPQQSASCAERRYTHGAVIELTADPADGWRVARWEGTLNDAATLTSNTVEMPNRDHAVRVIYERDAPVGAQIYLPVGLYMPCAFDPDESEDNDDAGQAKGALCPGVAYSGLPDDRHDVFSLNALAGSITVELINYPVANGVQLQLHHNEITLSPIGRDDNGVDGYGITLTNAPAGRYYIVIASQQPAGTSNRYTLTASFTMAR